MPTYQYKAKRSNAETVTGKIMADNREDAIEKINLMALIPITVEDMNPAAQLQGSIATLKVKRRSLYLFSRQLHNLLKSGLPILRALELIANQTKEDQFKKIIISLHYGIQGGKSFSDCLSDFPAAFPSLYIAMVKAGEESGNLHDVIASLARYLKQQEEVASKVRSAMAYPLFMLLFGVGTIFFVLTYVLPQITSLYDNLNQVLPLPTLIVMRISAFMIAWWMPAMIAVLVIWFAVQRWLVTPAGQMSQSRFVMALPFFGLFWKKVEIARFCRTFKLLLDSGVSVVKAIQLAIPVVKNQLLKNALAKCQEDLIAGRSFAESLRQAKIVPEIIGNLIAIGEESGSLAGPLDDIADSYEQDVDETIKFMTTMLEPLMIVLVGGVIGFIVVAMLLPVFQLDIFSR